GLSADMDCSRTRIVCARAVVVDCSWSWICRVRGHERYILRGCLAYSPRLIRERSNLVKPRGRACPLLNMVRNTLPPLLLQLVPPAFQLGHYGLEASNLLNGFPFDPRGMVVAQ